MAENTVTISVEEYADLVACRTKVHTACVIITNEHKKDIELFGSKGMTLNAELIETVLGYVADEACFEEALKKYKERKEKENETEN